ncbi:FAD-dependent monooxygenase [Nitratireductor pacificus]|uniref:Salicylate hydroxylase n=1 Tax=Nitratireductor pacificus pht-3B TaxID=391937 RepID=K2MHR8_9HYPH|nr:FAD-dependent monooxygenase [Nitratireductor pacificus]EKF20290.1 salicylate hydroxylase [Nitratireductor pacificus pht-3B]
MKEPPAVLIAGAGIAGLTMALALARHGFGSRVYEREPLLREVGAGLQLSPNATRILDRLGVLAALAPRAVQPGAIELRKAATLERLARVPLGAEAEQRWGAPYLVAHRADLQAALLACARRERAIELVTGATVEDAEIAGIGVRARIRRGWITEHAEAPLLIAADGVWSGLRQAVSAKAGNRFTGYLAWRATLPRDKAAGVLATHDSVTAFMHPRFHLVAYPVSGGRDVNLVAFTSGDALRQEWAQEMSDAPLRAAMADADPALRQSVKAVSAWTVWPIHAAHTGTPWTGAGRLALIGDAAHAMPPFAAQGAAMAIEDAAALATLLARHRDTPPVALSAYQRIRKPRMARVARRGQFNRFVWHAAGPVALARDLVLRRREETALMADFDWLYGFDAEAEIDG